MTDLVEVEIGPKTTVDIVETQSTVTIEEVGAVVVEVRLTEAQQMEAEQIAVAAAVADQLVLDTASCQVSTDAAVADQLAADVITQQAAVDANQATADAAAVVAANDAQASEDAAVAAVQVTFDDYKLENPPGYAAPSWPLAESADIMHLHPGMIYGGTAANVTSITFGNGLTMTAVAPTAPITWSVAGFYFPLDAYFTYTPPVVTFKAAAFFAQITWDQPVGTTAFAYPLNILASNTNGVLQISRKQRIMLSDIGPSNAYARTMSDLVSGSPIVVGTRWSTDVNDREYGGAHAVWLNGRIAAAGEITALVTPTEWQVGKAYIGTIHEGIVFTRLDGAAEALYPNGVDSEYICEMLAL